MSAARLFLLATGIFFLAVYALPLTLALRRFLLRPRCFALATQ